MDKDSAKETLDVIVFDIAIPELQRFQFSNPANPPTSSAPNFPSLNPRALYEINSTN